MSNPPPLPPLNYQTPPPGGRGPNSAGKVLLRILAGSVGGASACVIGVILAGALNSGWWFFLPPVLTLAGASFVALRYRRYGYVTGMVLGPFVLVSGLFLLLMIVCGVGSSFKF
jgi:hypothetical protein